VSTEIFIKTKQPKQIEMILKELNYSYTTEKDVIQTVADRDIQVDEIVDAVSGEDPTATFEMLPVESFNAKEAFKKILGGSLVAAEAQRPQFRTKTLSQIDEDTFVVWSTTELPDEGQIEVDIYAHVPDGVSDPRDVDIEKVVRHKGQISVDVSKDDIKEYQKTVIDELEEWDKEVANDRNRRGY